MCLSFTVGKLRDCKDVLDSGSSHGDGSYTIELGSQSVRVSCDMTTTGGGWTVSCLFLAPFQEAVDNSLRRYSASPFVLINIYKRGNSTWDFLHQVVAELP